MTKSMKRIHKVVVKRMVDTDPDTSYLGEYSNTAKGEFAIDRKHNDDCPRFWANADIPEDARECDCCAIGSREMPYFNPASVEKFDPAAKWIPASLKDVGKRREYWREAMEKNARQDYERVESLQRGSWYYLGIMAEATLLVPSGPERTDGIIQHITSGGLWGIESDSEADFLAETEQEQLGELREQLHALGFSKRAIAAAFKNVEHRAD